jgi:hypothetical protein
MSVDDPLVAVMTTPLLAEFQVPMPQIRHNVKAKQRFRIS